MSPAFPHHAIVGVFDTNREVELRGSITKLEWFNPHIWIYMEVADAAGSIDEWQCELGSPNSLVRGGWRKEDLPVGTILNVRGNPARDGSNTCTTRILTTADGRPVFYRADPPDRAEETE